MKRFINAHKKAVGAVAALAIVAGSGIGAYAYWSTGGSGTGQASTGTTTNNLVVTGTASASDLVPGSTGTLNVTITNNNPYSVRYNGVASIGQASAVGAPSCTNASPNLLVITLNSANTQDAGGTIIPPNGGHIDRAYANGLSWADDAVNSQNACKSVTLDIPVLTLN